MIRLVLFLAVLSVFSCSPCKRVQKRILKHPECFKMDTVSIKDTFITERVKSDTILSVFELKDTVEIVKENLKVKAIWLKDSIYISGECKTDTLIRIRKQTRKIFIPHKKTFWEKINNYFLYIALLLIAFKLFKK